MFARYSILVMALAMVLVGWAAYSSISRAGPRQDALDADWLAQAPPDGGPDRLAPPPPGEPRHPDLQQRLDRLRRIQEQLRELAGEEKPDPESLHRLSRQLDEALAPALLQRPGSSAGRPPERGPDRRGPREMRPPAEAGPRMNAMKGFVDFASDLQQLVSNPLQCTVIAVHGIVETSKDNPQQGIQALQSVLDQTDVLPARTAIHFGLKELYEKSGDRDAAIQQLAGVVSENAKAVKEHHCRRMQMDGPGPEDDRDRRPPPPPPVR